MLEVDIDQFDDLPGDEVLEGGVQPKSPRPTLRHQLVVGLYTLFLMAVMMLTLVLMLAGRPGG